eukprot:4882087-Pleurochrysis_carterae.AAC.2
MVLFSVRPVAASHNSARRATASLTAACRTDNDRLHGCRAGLAHLQARGTRRAAQRCEAPSRARRPSLALERASGPSACDAWRLATRCAAIDAR